MFRDLLAADPHRFFDASGIPMEGMFETKDDVYGSGTWNITENDTLEIKLKMIFNSTISRRGVAGREHNLSTPENDTGAQENQQSIISPNDYFYVRLQMKAVTGSGGGGGGGWAGPGGPTVVLTSFTNNSGFFDSEIVGLADITYPITLSDGVYTNYAPAYDPTIVYQIVYDAVSNEIWVLDAGLQILKFQRNSSGEFICYYDAYNRSTDMKFN
jgi:hypothetical protein